MCKVHQRSHHKMVEFWIKMALILQSLRPCTKRQVQQWAVLKQYYLWLKHAALIKCMHKPILLWCIKTYYLWLKHADSALMSSAGDGLACPTISVVFTCSVSRSSLLWEVDLPYWIIIISDPIMVRDSQYVKCPIFRVYFSVPTLAGDLHCSVTHLEHVNFELAPINHPSKFPTS